MAESAILLQPISRCRWRERVAAEDHSKPCPSQTGDKVIDIGCGPAQALQSLPDVEYLGLDINPDYIAFARRTYGDKGTFVVGDTRSLRSDSRFKDADIVIAVSVLHHLDDEEAVDCIRFADGALKIGGRFICLDACWIPNQGPFSKCHYVS